MGDSPEPGRFAGACEIRRSLVGSPEPGRFAGAWRFAEAR